MKVIMISGDKRLLEKGSEAYMRLELQRAQVERLDVFVWPQVHSREEIMTAAKKNGYDIVTAQDPFWRGLLGWRVARRYGTKLNLQVHTDLSAQPFFRRKLAHFLLMRADTVRVVSKKIANYLTQFNLRARISILPVYIDLARFRNIKRIERNESKKTILWIGRFEAEKDPLLALGILADVRAAGIDANLVMLGAGGLAGRLRSRTKEQDLPVEFPGWKDPAEYLAHADLAISTSQHESYGVSIIEALAAGVAVIAPDIGIAREAGAIVAPREKLGDAVAAALNANARGELKLALPSAEEWARQWRTTVI